MRTHLLGYTVSLTMVFDRLPVASLYIDVFEKIKALGFNCVSFYVDWALLEGKPGHYTAEGIFDLQPFFDAAKEAGIYLLARPGPYINAEVSGGGFPGWLQRVNGTLRTSIGDYLKSTDKYVIYPALLAIDTMSRLDPNRKDLATPRTSRRPLQRRRSPTVDRSFCTSPKMSTLELAVAMKISPTALTCNTSKIMLVMQESWFPSSAMMPMLAVTTHPVPVRVQSTSMAMMATLLDSTVPILLFGRMAICPPITTPCTKNKALPRPSLSLRYACSRPNQLSPEEPKYSILTC